jgi:hypothetical protein
MVSISPVRVKGHLDNLVNSFTLMRGAQFWLFTQDLSRLKAIHPRWRSLRANGGCVRHILWRRSRQVLIGARACPSHCNRTKLHGYCWERKTQGEKHVFGGLADENARVP